MGTDMCVFLGASSLLYCQITRISKMVYMYIVKYNHISWWYVYYTKAHCIFRPSMLAIFKLCMKTYQ